MNEELVEILKEQIETLNQIILTKDQIIANVEQQNDAYENYIRELERIIESYKLLLNNSINQLNNL
jgi:SMC interacting uncharacterized protein involved in chromosome segregation